MLVTLGGGDIHNTTVKIVEALGRLDIDDMQAIVVAGAANPHTDSLRAAVLGSGLNVTLLEGTDSMHSLMDWAEVAVSAAGSTCWELAFMGLPALVVTMAENQKPCAAFLEKMGIGMSLGSYDAVTPERVVEGMKALLGFSELRASMISKGRELVDGRGAGRVVDHLLEVTHSNGRNTAA